MIPSEALGEILIEYHTACDKFKPFHSGHEGYAVIKEELEELWEEVKKKKPSRAKMRTECKQIAAMAMRFMVDIITEKEGG